MDRLKDKVALVAGAGSIGPGWGNGKATAVTFAREGAKVFCADVNLAAAQETAAIITGAGGEARAFQADVTSAAEVAAMVAACRDAYGRIDVLDWHCAPRRQYSISLSGTAEIEVGDGTKARVGPGDVVLAEDLTGRGHVTRVIGDQPRFYAIVPLADG